jgi:hypothetical protein
MLKDLQKIIDRFAVSHRATAKGVSARNSCKFEESQADNPYPNLRCGLRFGDTVALMAADHNSCELLRAVVRRSESVPNQHFDQLAEKIIDWDSLLRLAADHRVLPMLFLRLADTGFVAPPQVQERLRTEYNRNMFHNLANAAELLAVLQAFKRDSIPAMPFKGVVLGASVYGNLTTRPSGDLDLLIDSTDLLQATAILQQRGYQLTAPEKAEGLFPPSDHSEYHFEREADGMVVELRWRLELQRLGRNLGLDWVWPGRRTTILAGAEVPNMNPERTLLVLCMHGCKHVWSRLIWICDVAQLTASSPDLDWKEATQESKRTGLSRALALGVLLAHRIADARVPPDILRRFEADNPARNLAQHIQNNLFDAWGNKPAGLIPYNIKLLDFHDRLRLITSLDLLRPNERDHAVLSERNSPSPLSYLIRPFRLLRDRSPR